MDWRTCSCRGTASASRPRSHRAGISQLAARKSLLVPTTRSTRCKKKRRLDRSVVHGRRRIVCHPTLVLPFLQDFDVSNARVGAERNSQKTEVIYYVSDLDAAPLEWTIRDVQNMAKVSTVTAGSITWESVHCGPALDQGRRHSSNARTCPALPGPADGICKPLRQYGSQSHQPHPASSWPHNPTGTASYGNLRRGWAAVSRTGLPGSHGGQYDTSDPQRRQSGIGFKRARDIAAPAHLGALIAAKPRIHGMIQDAVWTGLLPEHLLETRLTAVIEPATSTYLSRP